MKINLEDLENILYGACFLASGGGGNIGSAQKCIDESGFSNNDYVEVVNYSDIKDNEWIIPTSGMGDPVADFKPSELNNSMFNVIKLMQELYKDEVDGFEKFDYILPMEVGTINSILPILATKIAKDNGVDLKVINADPSGRATPSLPLTLFSGYEQKIVPNFIAGGTKNIDNEEPPYGTFNLKSIDTLQAAFEPLFTSEDFNSCSSFALYAKIKKI